MGNCRKLCWYLAELPQDMQDVLEEWPAWQVIDQHGDVFLVGLDDVEDRRAVEHCVIIGRDEKRVDHATELWLALSTNDWDLEMADAGPLILNYLRLVTLPRRAPLLPLPWLASPPTPPVRIVPTVCKMAA
jgi:hypothetical protein